MKPGGRYIDATVGSGGHARGLLVTSAPDGELLGIDADPLALQGSSWYNRRLYRRRFDKGHLYPDYDRLFYRLFILSSCLSQGIDNLKNHAIIMSTILMRGNKKKEVVSHEKNLGNG